MNEKDVFTYKALAELGLLKERNPTPELRAAYDRAHKSEDEKFLDDVEKLFSKQLGPAEHLSEYYKNIRRTEEKNFREDVGDLFCLSLMEMAYPVGIEFPEYTPQQINDAIKYAKDAEEITKLEEGGRFSLYKKDKFYILRDRNGETTYGWAEILSKILHGRTYNYLHIFYILPEFRKTGIALVLFHAIKETVNGHILIDGPVFPKGEMFINSLAKKGTYVIWAIDKKTEKREEYVPGMITHADKYAILIETPKQGLYGQWLPGSDFKTYFARYPEVIID